jgi:hypothetical protein
MLSAPTYKPGTILRLTLVRVPIYASTRSPSIVTVLSSNEGVAVVRIKGVGKRGRDIAQLTSEHLLVGFKRPAKYEVLSRACA